MEHGKLKVFIGSSVESLPVVRVIERKLSENERLAVTPWTGLKRDPGHFLDSLIAASSSFDAAVLVFGPDDLLISRGKKVNVPRDNVVFELGLFMGHLDTARTFVVAPNEWESNLKVLSDIASLNRVTYSPPRLRSSMTSRRKSVLLANALREATSELKMNLGELEPLEIWRGPVSIAQVTQEIIRSAAKPLPRSVYTIRNIALDMEQTWPILLRDGILENESIRKVRIETMMIDAHSPQIREMSSPTLSVKTALTQERRIVAYCKAHQKELAARRIEFSSKAYSDIPVFHGFLFNQKMLTISLCSVNGGRLVGAPNPYLAFEYPSQSSRDRTGLYLFRTFNAWFDFRWSRARPIWPRA